MDLLKVPLGIPAGWVYAPSTRRDIPNCDVQGCRETPKFEIYLGNWVEDYTEDDPWSDYWWYVCKVHRDLIKVRSQEREGL